ncbi:MAG: 1-acyl-sn-glycerol-3-phosphate acyltransferase [Candidatus Rokubacteria bacterium]|nr:1-acyl-sn-glycerol-3-phosphate acyltransferase [Candidatus Rokubacteria bacterium]MBI4592904.1 1-acyl-sn-glycerol-3-phosphate acyltransferase [Candidatus Rokubacteria bacterium]
MRTPVLDVFRPLVRTLCRLYFGLELRGLEHIPGSGPVLILPNHQTYADPPLVTIPIHRPVHYMAWSRLFAVPGLGGLIRRLRAFPVDIDAPDRRAPREVVRLLRAGEAVMIFPEGGRSADGGLGSFKPGAFRLAVSLGVSVLPVTIRGGHQAWPPGRLLPRPGRITITYHPLVAPDPSLGPTEAARRLLTLTRTAIAGALEPGPPA